MVERVQRTRIVPRIRITKSYQMLCNAGNELQINRDDFFLTNEWENWEEEVPQIELSEAIRPYLRKTDSGELKLIYDSEEL